MDLYNKMKAMIEEPSKLEEMYTTSYNTLKNLSWSKTGQQFSDIIQSTLEVDEK